MILGLIIKYGFSKLYGMPGWRLGWVIVPRDFARPMQKIQQNFFISPNSFVQWAGIAALKGPQDKVKRMVEIYNQRRKHLLKRLREIGLEVATEPTGAFYVLADARRYSQDSLKLSREILHGAKVAITPRIDFGSQAEGYLRFSYTNTVSCIERETASKLGLLIPLPRPLKFALVEAGRSGV